MTFFDSMKIAFSSIFAHKMRSFLTMLGIIIGVGSVITVVAIGKGGEEQLKSQFASTGNNTMQLYFEPKDFNEPIDERSTRFNDHDVENLKKIPGVENVIVTNENGGGQVSYNDNQVSAKILGITQEYFKAFPTSVVEGRMLSEQDFDQANRVAMIDKNAKKELFKDQSPIGEIIEIDGTPYRIIGVYKSNEPSFMGMPTQGEVMVGRTLWPVMYGTDDISNITLQAKSADLIKSTGDKAVKMLNDTKKVEGGQFKVFNMEQIQEEISKITGTMTLIIGSIAGISLLVGGIGVMNIMLVSVTERTREIGLRKALGATRKKILLQFLIEAMTLTTIGGIIGILFGSGGAFIVSTFAKWPPLVSLPVIIGGVLFSMIIGVVFGLIPANKAAKLNPIDALRYE